MQLHSTPKQLFDERLFTEVQRLHWSEITVRKVACELGFENDGYFNSFFKRLAEQQPKNSKRLENSR